MSSVITPEFRRIELGRNFMQMKFHGHDQINMYGRFYLARYCPKNSNLKKLKRSAEDHYPKIESLYWSLLPLNNFIVVVVTLHNSKILGYSRKMHIKCGISYIIKNFIVSSFLGHYSCRNICFWSMLYHLSWITVEFSSIFYSGW